MRRVRCPRPASRDPARAAGALFQRATSSCNGCGFSQSGRARCQSTRMDPRPTAAPPAARGREFRRRRAKTSVRLPDQKHPPRHPLHHQERRSQLVFVGRGPGDFRDRQSGLFQGAQQRGLPENVGIAAARDPDRCCLQHIGAERRPGRINYVEAEGQAGMAVFHDAEIDHPDARAALGLHHALQPIGQAGPAPLCRQAWSLACLTCARSGSARRLS